MKSLRLGVSWNELDVSRICLTSPPTYKFSTVPTEPLLRNRKLPCIPTL
jgi:hypothetical protein